MTVSSNAVSVSVYGTDKPGVASTTQEIVEASVAKYGYDSSLIIFPIFIAVSFLTESAVPYNGFPAVFLK